MMKSSNTITVKTSAVLAGAGKLANTAGEMLAEKALELVREQKRCTDSTLPPFNVS